ncbi:hypothetical protein FA09DRAFT_336914 [Tilletiopsis washingtonensis]|jgi:hypothetical protein|uniref:Uncharacterized protein n=1 Tax=Tilletiopsis washingtonensis TaxID=58919 RepID=A0A316ZEY1_9BASI|nr:hypothetical protein FA09DRAFT_336914 [Tilletiopsis washingtonensis]PWO00082.1 hypothetical protein FA09DRAFT_336914 [Tilletiopsis washingtonensis]
MPIALLLLLSHEAVVSISRKLERRSARKRGIDYSSLPRDRMGRARDPATRRRLSRNEERAFTEWLAQVETLKTREREWRQRGAQLPRYGEQELDGLPPMLEGSPVYEAGAGGALIVRSRSTLAA